MDMSSIRGKSVFVKSFEGGFLKTGFLNLSDRLLEQCFPQHVSQTHYNANQQ